jgi:predicted  nucleic acid-binding Zn-ribbon protein
MLTYVADDFIEVADRDIEILQRSLKDLDVEGPGGVAFEVQAYLCLHKDGDGQLCHLAFYSRMLKRSIVFAVIGPESKSELVREGEDCLTGLGFEMETVNLNFGSAMLQVVLRDIPSLQTVEYVDQFRKDRDDLLAKLEEESVAPEDSGDEDASLPESEQLKLKQELAEKRSLAERAGLRLAAEQRQMKQLQTLREEIERLFSPADVAPVPDVDDTAGRLEKMSAAIKKLEADLDEERSLRDFSDQIKSAAEKRIQELEETLVGYETKAAGSIKKSQATAKLTKRLNELDKELTEAVARADAERKLREEVEHAAEEIGRKSEQLNDELAEAVERVAVLAAENEVLSRNVEEVREELDSRQQAHSELEQRLEEALDAGKGADASARQLDALERELATANACLAEEQAAVEASNKELNEAREKIETLEQQLLAALQKAEESVRAVPVEPPQDEIDGLKAELAAARTSAEEAISSCDEQTRELDESRLRIKTLEKLLKKAETQKPPAGDVAALEAAEQRGVEIQEELDAVRGELGRVETELKLSERALTKAEVRIEVLEEELEKSRNRVQVQTVVQPVAAVPAVTQSPQTEVPSGPLPEDANLPHNVRRPPSKGAFFHVNWDQQELQVPSIDAVFEAWRSVYNVQLTLEGYPSQYCSGALIVLKEGKGKQLYMMFYLKQNERLLVYEPARKPKDTKGFKKALDEARKFMMLSGIEFEKVDKAELASALKSYLSQG